MIDVSNKWNITPMIVAPGKFAMLRGEGGVPENSENHCISLYIFRYIYIYIHDCMLLIQYKISVYTGGLH